MRRTDEHRLSPANERFIEEALASGMFSSRDALLDVAVDLLKKRLRRMIQQGIDQLDRGEGIPADEVFAELEKEAAKIVRDASKPRRR